VYPVKGGAVLVHPTPPKRPQDHLPALVHAGGHHGIGIADVIVGVSPRHPGQQGGRNRGRAPRLLVRLGQCRFEARIEAGVTHLA
jgi:hypothetical protein